MVEVIQQQPSPGGIAHVVVEARVVALVGLMAVGLVVKQRADGDEDTVALHAKGPWLAGPSAQDAEADFSVDVQVWVDALARVLDELDDGRDEGVVWRDLEVQLDELVAVDAVLGGYDVGHEVEHVFVLEESDVCFVG